MRALKGGVSGGEEEDRSCWHSCGCAGDVGEMRWFGWFVDAWLGCLS